MLFEPFLVEGHNNVLLRRSIWESDKRMLSFKLLKLRYRCTVEWNTGPIDFLKDQPEHMTFGRQIALYLASKSTCYNPQLGKTHGYDGEALPSGQSMGLI